MGCARRGRRAVLWASWAVQWTGRLVGPRSAESSSDGSGDETGLLSLVDGGSNQVFQQNENAQFTRVWWRRIAVAERTWKSAQPSSSLTCL
jgi:hypothetical protein